MQVNPYDAPYSFKFDPKSDAKALCGYSGIRNLGCICYMNSLMQQFFMIKPFRYGILSASLEVEAKEATDARKEDVLYQLQWLFGQLLLSDKRCCNPSAWCYAYKDESGKPTNFLVQQDAQVSGVCVDVVGVFTAVAGVMGPFSLFAARHTRARPVGGYDGPWRKQRLLRGFAVWQLLPCVLASCECVCVRCAAKAVRRAHRAWGAAGCRFSAVILSRFRPLSHPP